MLAQLSSSSLDRCSKFKRSVTNSLVLLYSHFLTLTAAQAHYPNNYDYSNTGTLIGLFEHILYSNIPSSPRLVTECVRLTFQLKCRGCGNPVVKVSHHGRHVMSSSPVPLKTRRVRDLCTLNLSIAETSSRWCGVVVRRGGASSDVVHVT
ncbi:uncharacterized protein TNCV_2993661 [Trichonephila clavipes]|nr:uncharacterized protein TNCV_2993661 [Trichonephila clavipes]